MSAEVGVGAGAAAGAEIAIRPVGALDVPVLAALHEACFADGLGGAVWSAAAIARILALPTTYGLLAVSGTGTGSGAAQGPQPDPEPAGFALARGAVDEAEILSLGVAPAARRAGFGRALVAALMARAAEQGARRLFLEVAEDNRAALGLYGAFGFSQVGRRPGYYARARGRAAALVLVLDLALDLALDLPPPS